MAQRVLVVDDEPDMVENCARILKRSGYQCLTATDPHRALALVDAERPDVLLTDLKMPGMDGMELLRRARELDPALPVILITAFASIESAVAAIKDGAFDYLPKNFSVDQLRVAVERGLRQRELQLENRNLREQLQGTLGFENLIGRSPVMQKIFELVRKAARSDANILVLGESGTGKELIARAIHANSPRATQAFVPVDCASLPEQLLESELFGHEKGAFTGAVEVQARPRGGRRSGHALPRRDRRAPARAPGQAACECSRSASSGTLAGRPRSTSTCGWCRRPIGTCARRSPRGSFARSSTTAST